MKAHIFLYKQGRQDLQMRRNLRLWWEKEKRTKDRVREEVGYREARIFDF